MTKPIKIHPFDVFRLLMEGDKYSIMRRALEAEVLQHNQLIINGILYEQSIEIQPTEAALKVIQ